MITDTEERPPYVVFETRAVEDRNASINAGHYVAKDVDYALITPPGSHDLHEEVLDSWLEKAKMNARNGRMNPRWVEAWTDKAKQWRNGQEIPVDGIPIKGWTILSPAQCESLLFANIRTVEDLARINDEGLSRIGMGGIDLKKKAIAWLQATKDHGPLTMRVTTLEQENEKLTLQNESLVSKNKMLMAQIETGEKPSFIIEPEVDHTSISMSDITPDINELDSLKDQYLQKFGKKPHHFLKEDGLRKKLAE